MEMYVVANLLKRHDLRGQKRNFTTLPSNAFDGVQGQSTPLIHNQQSIQTDLWEDRNDRTHRLRYS